jgi:hypothetical protein
MFLNLISLILVFIFHFLISRNLFSNLKVLHILTLQPLIFLINIGITAIIDPLIPGLIRDKVFVLFFISLIELTSIILFRWTIKVKLSYDVNLIEFLTLLTVCILLFLIFIYFTDASNLYLTSGDGQAHLKVIDDIGRVRQRLFSHGFTYSGELISYGNYYPRSAHYLANVLNLNNSNLATIYYFTICLAFSLFWPLSLFHFVKIYNSSSLSLPISIYLLSLNIFPLGLIWTNNFSNIFGIILAVSLYIIFSYLNYSLVKSAIFIFISAFIIFTYHPSSVLTFAILLFLNSFIAYKFSGSASIFRFFLRNKFVYPLFIFMLALTAALCIFFLIIPIFDYLYYFLDAFVKSLPKASLNFNYHKVAFFSFEKWLYYINYFYNLTFINSFLFIPNIVLILYMSLKHIKFNRNFILLYAIYITFITSNFFAGLPRPISYLALTGFFYYQSPIRIAHIGVLVSSIILAYSTKNSSLKPNSLLFYFLVFITICYTLLVNLYSLQINF